MSGAVLGVPVHLPLSRVLALKDGAAVAELLQWHEARHTLPDSDITVLAWTREPCGAADWCSAWWDGEQWIDCASGGVIHLDVTHWAQPEGPGAG